MCVCVRMIPSRVAKTLLARLTDKQTRRYISALLSPAHLLFCLAIIRKILFQNFTSSQCDQKQEPSLISTKLVFIFNGRSVFSE